MDRRRRAKERGSNAPLHRDWRSVLAQPARGSSPRRRDRAKDGDGPTDRRYHSNAARWRAHQGAREATDYLGRLAQLRSLTGVPTGDYLIVDFVGILGMELKA